jgi:hypothetical protein
LRQKETNLLKTAFNKKRGPAETGTLDSDDGCRSELVLTDFLLAEEILQSIKHMTTVGKVITDGAALGFGRLEVRP